MTAGEKLALLAQLRHEIARVKAARAMLDADRREASKRKSQYSAIPGLNRSAVRARVAALASGTAILDRDYVV